ncbi:MAG TPA: FAD-dependent oxidoreductase [Epulopiscium sp.]|nr:FAD-dependent oxidoreductase [Candidatus Epulonipiscium sp.]
MKSIWSLDSQLPRFNSLKSDIETDVCVIGAGITGILTAYLLTKQGVDCILIESNTIASGVTPYTSAKVTCQHGLIYYKIINQFGIDKAVQYAKANSDALNMYRTIIKDNQINCNFKTTPTYLYTTEDNDDLNLEFSAMESLGLRGSLTTHTTLPFEVKLALKMDEQAQFNPLAFLSSIALNLSIYENTKALEVKDHTVLTTGGKITADNIIITTHFPFINAPGYYFARMHQERSYDTALKNAGTLDGAYLGIDDISYSFRTYKDMIVFGGCGHRTGENEKGGNYTKLSSKALEFYPKSQQICSWATQDCMTHDGIPYIGEYSTSTDHLYVATGFNKWGMTSSMASAMILTDMILGKVNDCQEVFSPQRSNLMASAKKFTIDGAETVSGLIKQNLYIPSAELEDVEVGHGGIIDYKGEKIGVYKKTSDDIYIVSTKCPHLGCQLAWNPDDFSWDCPCHGSRFDYEGSILNNPSQKGLDHEKPSY